MADAALPLWSVLLVPVVVTALAAGAVALDTALGGPGRAPAHEVARLLVQQGRTVPGADRLLARIGVVLLPVAALLAALVLPLGYRAAGDLQVGIVWFNAMEVLAWAAVWLVGWGSNSALGLAGGYRMVAQGLAYELPHMFALITAGLAAESLRVADVVARQAGLWSVVWMPVAFLVYLASAAGMAFWGPGDAPLGRDLAGGAGVELAGVDRLLFRAGRWLLFVVAVAFSVPLFLGGGHGPLLPAWAWTAIKTFAVVAGAVWLRRRLPSTRMDRFAELAWVVLIPLSILQALAVALVVLNR